MKTVHKRKFLYIPLYFIILALLALVLFYLATPRYSYRNIKLHMSQETVTAIEEGTSKLPLTDADDSLESLQYKNITLASGLTANLDYTFSPNGTHPLTSIFVLIPITSDNQDAILTYLASTFPEVKNDSTFTLNTSKFFDIKSTSISLFHADNSDSYCIHITYKYNFTCW